LGDAALTNIDDVMSYEHAWQSCAATPARQVCACAGEQVEEL